MPNDSPRFTHCTVCGGHVDLGATVLEGEPICNGPYSDRPFSCYDWFATYPYRLHTLRSKDLDAQISTKRKDDIRAQADGLAARVWWEKVGALMLAIQKLSHQMEYPQIAYMLEQLKLIPEPGERWPPI